MPARVTVTDLETGETETIEIRDDDYFLLTTGRCYVSFREERERGQTHILLIEDRAPGAVTQRTLGKTGELAR